MQWTDAAHAEQMRKEYDALVAARCAVERTTSVPGSLPPSEGDVLVWAAGRRMPDLASNREVHVTAAALAARASGASRIVYLSSGECYGDAADAQSGKQRRDVEAEVLEPQEHDDGP